MSADDKKRYYWLKLKKDFFQQHQIKVLKSLPNGRLYALIYLELMAESTTHNGKLRYSKLLPYDTVTLASVIDEDKDNLEKAIETFVKLELVEIMDDGTIYMSELQKLIGSETGQTIRKNKAKLEGGKIYPKNTLELRVKSIDITTIINKYIEAGYDKDKVEKLANSFKIASEQLNYIPANVEEIFAKCIDKHDELPYIITCFKNERKKKND